MLEGRLGASLAILRQRIAAEALNRDVAVRETARTLDSIRAAEEFRRRIEAGDSLLLDSLRLDSLRADSLRRNAPGATPTDAFFAPTPFCSRTRRCDETPSFDETTLRAFGRPFVPGGSAPTHDGGAGAS